MSFQLSARTELGKSSFNLPQMDGHCLCVAIIYTCAQLGKDKKQQQNHYQ